MKKAFILFFGCFVSALLLGHSLAAQTKEETIDKVFRVDPGQPAEMDFRDVDGRLHLYPSAEGTITVKITKEARVRDSRRAENLLRETKVEISQSGNAVTVRVRYPRIRGIFFWLRDSGRVNVSSEIGIPARTRVKAELVDGSILGDDLEGNIALKAVDGDIRLVRPRGITRANAVDGRITIDGAFGNIQAETVDGRIEVSGTLQALDLRTIDGDVRVKVASGSAMEEDWRIRTTDGDIDLSLPAEFSAEFSLQTGDGRITTDIPLVASGAVLRREMRGRLNSGGRLFSIRSVDGDIAIRKN
jgi:hypothetical protein